MVQRPLPAVRSMEGVELNEHSESGGGSIKEGALDTPNQEGKQGAQHIINPLQ